MEGMDQGNWSRLGFNYWDTARQAPQPRQGAGGGTDWGKTLVIIALVVLGVPVVIAGIGLLACLVMLAGAG